MTVFENYVQVNRLVKILRAFNFNTDFTYAYQRVMTLTNFNIYMWVSEHDGRNTTKYNFHWRRRWKECDLPISSKSNIFIFHSYFNVGKTGKGTSLWAYLYHMWTGMIFSISTWYNTSTSRKSSCFESENVKIPELMMVCTSM